MNNDMQTRIIRRVKERDFTIIQNAILTDRNLTWKAKGIMCYLLSKPADWKARVVDISNNGKDGGGAVTSGLLELRRTGYAQLQKHVAKGRVEEWQLVVDESCPFEKTDAVTTVNAEVEKPEVENPLLENRGHTKTKERKTERTKTDKKSPPAGADGPVVEVPSDYRQFTNALTSAFFDAHGFDYEDNAGDWEAVARAFKRSKDWHELVDLATWAWTHIDQGKDPFMFDQCQTLRGLFAQVNQLRARKATNGTGTQYRVNGVEMGCRNKNGQEERNKAKLRAMGIQEFYTDEEEAKRDERIVGAVRMEWFGMLRDMREE